MPTASKLVAAVLFAAMGFLTLIATIPHLEPGTQVGYARELSAVTGFAVGWLVMGRMTGMGYREAINSGLMTALQVVFWALLVFSIYTMLQKSMRKMYDGPMQAVVGIFEQMLAYGKIMLVPEVIGIVLVGGVLGGILTEWAGKRWS